MARPKRSVPIYLEIRQHIIKLIEAGDLKENDRIPSDGELADLFSTTRSTVAHALQHLVFEGIVDREVGRGTFVAPSAIVAPLETSRVRSFEEQVAEDGGKIEYSLLSFGKIPAGDEGRRLGIASENEIFRLERLRIVNGSPISVERRFFSLEIGHLMTVEGLSNLPFLSILEREAKKTVKQIRGIVRAAAATTEVARLMKIETGTPLLVRNYMVNGPDDTPLSYGESLYKDNFHIKYEIDANT